MSDFFKKFDGARSDDRGLYSDVFMEIIREAERNFRKSISDSSDILNVEYMPEDFLTEWMAFYGVELGDYRNEAGYNRGALRRWRSFLRGRGSEDTIRTVLQSGGALFGYNQYQVHIYWWDNVPSWIESNPEDGIIYVVCRDRDVIKHNDLIDSVIPAGYTLDLLYMNKSSALWPFYGDVRFRHGVVEDETSGELSYSSGEGNEFGLFVKEDENGIDIYGNFGSMDYEDISYKTLDGNGFLSTYTPIELPSGYEHGFEPEQTGTFPPRQTLSTQEIVERFGDGIWIGGYGSENPEYKGSLANRRSVLERHSSIHLYDGNMSGKAIDAFHSDIYHLVKADGWIVGENDGRRCLVNTNYGTSSIEFTLTQGFRADNSFSVSARVRGVLTIYVDNVIVKQIQSVKADNPWVGATIDVGPWNNGGIKRIKLTCGSATGYVSLDGIYPRHDIVQKSRAVSSETDRIQKDDVVFDMNWSFMTMYRNGLSIGDLTRQYEDMIVFGGIKDEMTGSQYDDFSVQYSEESIVATSKGFMEEGEAMAVARFSAKEDEIIDVDFKVDENRTTGKVELDGTKIIDRRTATDGWMTESRSIGSGNHSMTLYRGGRGNDEDAFSVRLRNPRKFASIFRNIPMIGVDVFTYNEEPPYINPILEGLDAFWNFKDGSLVSSVGNRTLEKAVSAPSANTDGRVDGCMEFNGSTGTFLIDKSKKYSSDMDEFTVSVWVQMTQIKSGASCIVSLQGWNESGESSGISIEFDSGRYIRIGTQGPWISTRLNDCNDLKWHHVVLTKAHSLWKVFFDGLLVWTSTSVSSTLYDGYLTIGGYSKATPTSYLGEVRAKIDEVGVWTRALSTDEVLELMTCGNKNVTYPFEREKPEEVGLHNGLVSFSNFSNSTAVDHITGKEWTFFTGSTHTFVQDGQVGEAICMGKNGTTTSTSHAGESNLSVSKKITNVGTIAGWFRVRSEQTTSGGWHNIIFRTSYGTASGVGLELYQYGTTQFTVGAYINNGITSVNKVTFQIPTEDVPLGKWHHACVTWSGRSFLLYVDGVLVGTKTMTADTVYLEGDTFSSGPTLCDIDELGAWNRELSAEEVELLYMDGLSGITYPFDNESSLVSGAKAFFNYNDETLTNQVSGTVYQPSNIQRLPTFVDSKVGKGMKAYEGAGYTSIYADGDAIQGMPTKVTFACWLNLSRHTDIEYTLAMIGIDGVRLILYPPQSGVRTLRFQATNFYACASSSQYFGVDETNHFCVVADAEEGFIKWYINGKQVQNTSVTWTPTTFGFTKMRLSYGGKYIEDEIGAWERCLSDSEVMALYLAGKRGATWPFDINGQLK